MLFSLGLQQTCLTLKLFTKELQRIKALRYQDMCLLNALDFLFSMILVFWSEGNDENIWDLKVYDHPRFSFLS